ncbi:MAG: D-alanine--D-alanine ligase [Holosporales bacterium]|jgi:D-alanine-D-alanine ligase|nr:D-alanine--D-alanine ligase [Holosporales bacterium]
MVKVAIITGGWSAEREISLNTAQSVLGALQQYGSDKYEACIIDFQKDLIKFISELTAASPDVAFLGIHGQGAEDGILQGLLDVLGIPYTSSGMTSSAVTMDKVLTKLLLERDGILSPEWEVLPPDKLSRDGASFDFPYVIKPRNEGSSVGVSIIHNQDDLQKAIAQWQWGPHVLVERYVTGQEIQVAVINGKALGALEIRPSSEFFDYRAKYTAGATEHIFPARAPQDVCESMLRQSEKAFERLECRGVVRAEFIYGECPRSQKGCGGVDALFDSSSMLGTAQRLRDVFPAHNSFCARGHAEPQNEKSIPTGQQIYLLEINSQPGLTAVSIVPDIARNVGLSYFDMIEMMIASAKTGAE